MIAELKAAAEAAGITAVLTNSNERIETQLNSLTEKADLPLMLISWDLDISLSFNEHGFLNNPSIKVISLLVDKADSTEKQDLEDTSEAMGEVFKKFIQELHSRLKPLQTSSEAPAITEAGYQLVPKHGAGKHSGVLGRFTMNGPITNCP